MRFILGILVAMVLVFGFLVFTSPTPPETAVQSSPVAIVETPPELIMRLGDLRIDAVEGWNEVSLTKLRELDQFKAVAIYFDRRAKSLVLMNEDQIAGGLLATFDSGSSETRPLDVINDIAARHASISDVGGVIWSPRAEQVGTLDGASFAARFETQGQVGTGTAKGAFYAVSANQSGIFIVTFATIGSVAEAQLEKMIATVRVE